MQPNDLGLVIGVNDPAVAPDGARVAVVVGHVDLEANRGRSALWLVAAADGTTRRLTSGDHADTRPRWSPDGTRLAFARTIAGSDGGTSVLVLPADGPGEPTVVATGPEGIDALDWSPDGTRLAWCTRVPDVEPGTADRDRPPRQIRTLRTTLDDQGWTVDRRRHVFVGAADGGAPPRAVTAGPFDHDDVRWSPDGTTLVVVAPRHEGWDLEEVADLWLVDPDPAGGEPAEPRRLTGQTTKWSSPAWSSDGRRIAAIEYEGNTGYHNPRPMVLDVASGATLDAAPGLDRTFAPFPGARAPVWVDGDTAVLASAEDHGRVTLFRLDPSGAAAPAPVTEGDQVVAGFDQAGGTLATIVTDVFRPGELEVGGHRTTFTAAFVAACPPVPARRFEVPSPLGDGDVEAWLFTPPGCDPDDPGAPGAARWPLLIGVHGGPMSQYGAKWFDEFQLLAGAGFAVLASNPHGSTGREDSWQRAIRSPKAALEPGSGWGGADADDVLAVVDGALERWPIFDPARVGIFGGSYGGFMTTWLLARADRFAAGVSERAVNNLLSEEWSSDEGGSFHRELGVSHLDDPEEYTRMSPLTYVRGITAPILILHSEHDLRCHPEQADALFTALRLLGHPDVEYWRFPGEGHEMSRSGSPKHRIRRAELINAFFERTIGGGPR